MLAFANLLFSKQQWYSKDANDIGHGEHAYKQVQDRGGGCSYQSHAPQSCETRRVTVLSPLMLCTVVHEYVKRMGDVNADYKHERFHGFET